METILSYLHKIPHLAILWVEMAMGRGGAGRGRRMRFLSPPRMVSSCPVPAPPCMPGKTLSPYPRPLGPRKALPHSVKLYFLLICSTTSTIFLMKPISLIKIYLKLQLNLSHPIKSNQFLEKII